MKAIRYIHIIAALLVAALASSCSVKEDRTPCPSYLTIYYDQAVPVMKANDVHTGVVTSVTNAGGFDFRLSVDPEEYREGLEVAVEPKSLANVSGIAGVSLSEISGSRLTYRRGEPADRIWAGADQVDCTGELAEHHITLHKQFAVMHVTFRGSGAYQDLRMEARAECDAFEVATLIPVRGDFRCAVAKDGEDSFSTVLPRQDNDALMLYLWSGEDLLSEIPVGKNIASAGYNWAKRDLDDIEVLIDYAVPDVRFSILPWKDGGYESYEI